MGDVWAVAEEYEAYVGRWSRPVAREFVACLGVPAGGRWLDVGRGTGALTGTVRAAAGPALVAGVDRSRGFLTRASVGRTGRTSDLRLFKVLDGPLALLLAVLPIPPQTATRYPP